jgi:hypothetical protein
MKRIVSVAVLVVLGAACSGSHRRASSPTPPSATTSSDATVPTRSSTCAGCQRSVAATAGALCEKAFGKEVVGSAGTTVGVVRRSGIGIVGGVFKAAFPGLRDDQLAAWCMLATSPGCYDESAVAMNGVRQHIAVAGCGWSKGPPHPGPAIWTD